MHQKVLFIIPSLNYGGAEMLLSQQVQWLKKNGWQASVAILSDKNDPQLVNELGLDPGHVLIFHSSHAVLNNRAIAFALQHRNELADFARKLQVKNIVAHLPLAHFWGRLIKLKIPTLQLLVYHHSMQYQANPLNTAGKKIFNTAQKILARKTDDVSICISEAVKENIEKHFVLKNPAILYNAVPDRGEIIFSPGKKDMDQQEPSCIKLVLPGRLHPSKGHLFFLKVFKQLTTEFQQQLKLVIAGGGGLEKEIHGYIRQNNLETEVTVTGFLSNELLLEKINNANLVLIPSLSEGLGIVGIEALMLGKTVIASNTGGLKEIFTHGKNGYVFEAGVYESCLNVMRSVLSNLPSSLLPAAVLREDYKHRFSFDVYMERFTALLKKE